MTIGDFVLFLWMGIAIVFFRKDWKKSFLYVFGGIAIADIASAILILAIYHWHPRVLAVPKVLMPVGGILGAIYWLYSRRQTTPPESVSESVDSQS